VLTNPEDIAKGLYQHYKGPYYKVLDVARHSETEECVVVYQALYGDKGLWVRPASMFGETVIIDGKSVPRFALVNPQTEVFELAVLDIKAGEQTAFEHAFRQAQSILESMPGYINHSLSHCVENSERYVLLVNWQDIDSHEKGFRQSDQYLQWKALLHGFYDPFPSVEHYSTVVD